MMSIRDRYDFSSVTNEAERFVIDELEQQLPESGVCTCPDCVLDITTYALNRLKPNYRVSIMGSMYAQAFDEKYMQEIRAVVQKAIAKIKENPSH
jgi:competence protein ComFB